MIPAVIYAAKSTEDKHGSIPTQLADCRTMAEREGWTIVGEFSDEAFRRTTVTEAQGSPPLRSGPSRRPRTRASAFSSPRRAIASPAAPETSPEGPIISASCSW